MPPQVAPRARASVVAATSGLPLQLGWPVEPNPHVVEADAGCDRHAVPLIEADVCDVIAEFEQRQGRELAVRALGLLHGQHVDIGAPKPIEDTIQPGANRIHIPGGQPQQRRSQARRSRALGVAAVNCAVGHG